jgi:DNA-binding MarR family transcriptional regulator
VEPANELNVGLLLFIPYRAMENRVFAALAAAGFDDFTPAQARVMQRIGPDGTRLTELAEAAQVTKQTASFLVDQLERAGYVARTPDPSDARARLVRIAERGAAAQPVAAAAVAEVEAEWRAHLGERDWDRMRGALSRLRQITDLPLGGEGRGGISRG